MLAMPENAAAGLLTEPPSFTCPRCGRTSHHPMDVTEGYCGACHDWTGEGTDRPRSIYNSLTGGITIPHQWLRLFGGSLPRHPVPAACYQSEYGFDVHIRGACRCQR